MVHWCVLVVFMVLVPGDAFTLIRHKSCSFYDYSGKDYTKVKCFNTTQSKLECCRHAAKYVLRRLPENKLGVHYMEVNGLRLEFDSEQIAGKIEPCFSRSTRSCQEEFYLLPLPLFSSGANDGETFWNLTWPLSAHWVRGLHVGPRPAPLWPGWMEALHGTALKALRVSAIDIGASLTLRNMSRLEILQVTGTIIESIDTGDFADTPNLQELILSNNKLTTIPTGISNVSLTLKKLDLSKQNVENFQFSTEELEHLTFLEELNLSDMNLDILNEIELPSLENLQRLYLKNCSIKSFKPNQFELMKSLKTLILADNNLTSWPTLHNLDLQHLDLSGNKLIDVVRLPSVSVSVQKLNLSRNLISSWTSGTFPIGMEELDLSNNEITVITKDILEDLKQILRIRLRNNPFDCDNCENQDFEKWIQSIYYGKIDDFMEIQCKNLRSTKVTYIWNKKTDRLKCTKMPVIVILLQIGVPLGFIILFVVSVFCAICRFKKELARMGFMLGAWPFHSRSPFDK